jgi:hypothetical protein
VVWFKVLQTVSKDLKVNRNTNDSIFKLMLVFAKLSGKVMFFMFGMFEEQPRVSRWKTKAWIWRLWGISKDFALVVGWIPVSRRFKALSTPWLPIQLTLPLTLTTPGKGLEAQSTEYVKNEFGVNLNASRYRSQFGMTGSTPAKAEKETDPLVLAMATMFQQNSDDLHVYLINNL